MGARIRRRGLRRLGSHSRCVTTQTGRTILTVTYTLLFDSSYVLRALALCRSLEATASHVRLYGLDDGSARLFRRLELPGATVVGPSEYMAADVAGLRRTRSPAGFAFTLKPIVLTDAAERGPDSEWVCYLDCDGLVFDDPAAMLSGAPDGAEACFTPHHFSPPFEPFMEDAGRFNAGCVAFRASTGGLSVLGQWRELCLEWCEAEVRDGLYCDQKYLQHLADRCENVWACDCPGANAGPWSIGQYSVTRQDEGAVFLDDQPLFYYHFQGMAFHSPSTLNLYTDARRLVIDSDLYAGIYEGYIAALWRAARELVAVGWDWRPAFRRRTLHQWVDGMARTVRGEPNNRRRLAVPLTES